MSNTTVKKVNAENMDRLQRVLGTFDENVNLIMHELDVIIRVDGLQFVVTGFSDKVDRAVSVLESLVALAKTGDAVDRGRVRYCIELSREDKAKDIIKLSSGAIAIT